MKRRSIHIGLVLSVMAAAFTGCALVDEDMRDCEADHKINYELRLVTNLTTELQTQLSTQVELQAVATALQNELAGIFTDYAVIYLCARTDPNVAHNNGIFNNRTFFYFYAGKQN